MNSNATPGIFGLDVSTLGVLLANDTLGTLIVLLMNGLLRDNIDQKLLLTLLTAISKGKGTDDPTLLRPISVTSVWYKLIGKIFVNRVSAWLPELYSRDQHGFCPSRSCSTALFTILQTIELAKL